ncbi:MAG: SRPBCC family protein [Aliishimia sp.]
MKFSAKEDIDAPIQNVFEMLSDFETFERSAMRRGAEVQRTSDHVEPGVGITWDVAFVMRGRRRQMALQMVEYEAPTRMKIEAISPSLASNFVLELVALSRGRTRIAVELDLKPKNLSARLLVQSLKMAKTTLTKRFKLRVAEYSKDIEERYHQVS